MIRRHTAAKASAAETLQLQLSGYGVNRRTMNEICARAGVKEPNDLAEWDEVNTVPKSQESELTQNP